MHLLNAVMLLVFFKVLNLPAFSTPTSTPYCQLPKIHCSDTAGTLKLPKCVTLLLFFTFLIGEELNRRFSS